MLINLSHLGNEAIFKLNELMSEKGGKSVHVRNILFLGWKQVCFQAQTPLIDI